MFILHKDSSMENGWEWASNVAWFIVFENKWLSDIYMKASRQEQILFFSGCQGYKWPFSHCELSLHLKDGFSRNFYHQSTDESFCHIQWSCSDLQSCWDDIPSWYDEIPEVFFYFSVIIYPCGLYKAHIGITTYQNSQAWLYRGWNTSLEQQHASQFTTYSIL